MNNNIYIGATIGILLILTILTIFSQIENVYAGIKDNDYDLYEDKDMTNYFFETEQEFLKSINCTNGGNVYAYNKRIDGERWDWTLVFELDFQKMKQIKDNNTLNHIFFYFNNNGTTKELFFKNKILKFMERLLVIKP